MDDQRKKGSRFYVDSDHYQYAGCLPVFGVHFTFTGELKENGIRISKDGKGRWMDNVFIERLWRSVKYEEVYTKEYASVKELTQSLKRYFDFYNFERTHQSLDGKTPAELYFGTAAALKAT